jgi:hypothetical protein
MERNQQVALMAEICPSGEMNMIWLGELACQERQKSWR